MGHAAPKRNHPPSRATGSQASRVLPARVVTDGEVERAIQMARADFLAGNLTLGEYEDEVWLAYNHAVAPGRVVTLTGEVCRYLSPFDAPERPNTAGPGRPIAAALSAAPGVARASAGLVGTIVLVAALVTGSDWAIILGFFLIGARVAGHVAHTLEAADYHRVLSSPGTSRHLPPPPPPPPKKCSACAQKHPNVRGRG